jgi:TatD DNase family protein
VDLRPGVAALVSFDVLSSFYDTHAHLDDEQFAADLPQVIERAQAAGITKINCIGTDLASSKRAIEIAEAHPNVFAVVGWHPSYATEAPEDLRPALFELARHPKVVGLGESGLDYYRLPSKKKPTTSSPQPAAPEPDSEKLQAKDGIVKAKQAGLFRQHLEVAAETGLGVVIHERESMADLLMQLEPFSSKVRGVFHCFAGDENAMQRVLAMGSIVSFTGILTFKSGQNVRDTFTATPLGKFMLETDSPYLAPPPYRGKRCEPAYVKEIAAAAAQIKGCTVEELSGATNAAATNFFRKSG